MKMMKFNHVSCFYHHNTITHLTCAIFLEPLNGLASNGVQIEAGSFLGRFKERQGEIIVGSRMVQ